MRLFSVKPSALSHSQALAAFPAARSPSAAAKQVRAPVKPDSWSRDGLWEPAERYRRALAFETWGLGSKNGFLPQTT